MAKEPPIAGRSRSSKRSTISVEPLDEARREVPVTVVERERCELREAMRLRRRHGHRAQHLALLQPVACFDVAVLDTQCRALEVARHRAERAADAVELVRAGRVLAHTVDALGADHRPEQRGIGSERGAVGELGVVSHLGRDRRPVAATTACRRR